jgi:FolB domain-containing protein
MTIDHVLASGVAPRPVAPRAIYRIVVRDLLLKCRIGIYDHERMAPQRVRINVDLAVSESVTDTDDDIANVYNYEDVIIGTKAVIASGHIDLVETLAEQIAAHCLKDSRVEDVRVRVEKLDVYAEAESVGIEIERRQSKNPLSCTPSAVIPQAVIKLGGSLWQGGWLRSWLDLVVGKPVVVVPGGGPFADCVRKVQKVVGFGDQAAHQMALTAMTQYGRMLVDLAPGLQPVSTLSEIGRTLGRGQTPLWLPDRLTDHPDIPPSWDVTSDSLAAWLGGQLGASRLMLVKSAALPPQAASLGDLVRASLVDPAFGRFAGSLEVSLVAAQDAEPALQALARQQSFGTRIMPDGNHDE